MDWLNFDFFAWSFAVIVICGILINAPIFFWSNAAESDGFRRWSPRVNLLVELAFIAWGLLLLFNLERL